jgi:uncharacterized membrane protein
MKELKDDKLLNVKVWRYLVNFWAVILYGVIMGDFYTRNGLTEFLGPVSAIYLAALAIYSAQKEFERWHDYHMGRHPGEVYVFAWTILVIALLILEVVYRGAYKLPTEVYTTYIVVIGVLAITKRSKKNYKMAKRKGK